MVDFQSSNVDGHADNDILIFMFHASYHKKPAMNSIHYSVHCFVFCPIHLLQVFILCDVIGHFASIIVDIMNVCMVIHCELKIKCFIYVSGYIIDSFISFKII